MASIPGYQTQRDDTDAPYVDISGDAVPVQWRLFERHANSLTITARDIIDDARARHWTFAEVQLGDGAAVRWLNARQRHLLLLFREGLKGLVTVTVRTNTVMPTPGYRVGVTPRGVPYERTTEGDGYAVYLTESDEVPYIDTAGVPIASAPIPDGFPTPVEVISLMAMKSVYNDGTTAPVTITSENQRTVGMPGRQLTAFASGSRVAPLRRPGAPNALQSWESVQSVELSYIPFARITQLCCLLTFPSILVEALTAGMAAYFSMQARACTQVERSVFLGDRNAAEAILSKATHAILGELPRGSVIFKG